jgi:acetyl esterase/lipase
VTPARRIRRVRYGRDRRNQWGHLHLPAGPGPHPVAVVLHGGFWRGIWNLRLTEKVSADLAVRGWAAWNVEYRRTGRLGDGGWPNTFLDVAAAIDHAARVASEHELDVGRVGTVGHSAGGHLALWAASRATLPEGAPGADPAVRIRLAVGMAPVPDLVRAHELGVGGQAVARLLGGPPDVVPGRYELASPAARVPFGVRQVLVHGTDDGAVPLSLSREYAEAASAAGDDVELITVPDEGHMACLDTQSAAWHSAAAALQHV